MATQKTFPNEILRIRSRMTRLEMPVLIIIYRTINFNIVGAPIGRPPENYA